MPITIKSVLFLLFLSAFVAATGTYLDMEILSDDGSYDPYIYTMDILWLGIIAWVAWNLSVKKRDIRLTVILVGLVIIGFEVWDFIEFGFSSSNLAYGVELALCVGMLGMLNTAKAKEWYSDQN
jgi:hypothetical protein